MSYCMAKEIKCHKDAQELIDLALSHAIDFYIISGSISGDGMQSVIKYLLVYKVLIVNIGNAIINPYQFTFSEVLKLDDSMLMDSIFSMAKNSMTLKLVPKNLLKKLYLQNKAYCQTEFPDEDWDELIKD